MAVRRQLLQFFQESRTGGAIMVERSRPETRNWRQEQERTKVLEDSSSSVLKDRRLRLEECMLYQCQQCHTVLGDSLDLCAQEEKLGIIACFKVTNDVNVEDSVMVCIEGDFMGCTYNMLNCRSCNLNIGIKLLCSASLAYLRGFFCLFKDSVVCYMLKTKTTVKASKMTFPTVSLKERVQKLKENLVLMNMHIEVQHKKLEERSQQTIVAKKHCYKPRPYPLAPGHRKKLNN
ncbi:PREDICTED: protein Mis18-beta [Gekko japonicus]|uniref:Protein Mis18-beta n=1 Tax=Gekko japonicus TaxID=146911 RepID=A0ABM1LGB9_GEKJA|nr:PREDICTED: protein Mis18-beta [Gekko japonicus]